MSCESYQISTNCKNCSNLVPAFLQYLVKGKAIKFVYFYYATFSFRGLNCEQGIARKCSIKNLSACSTQVEYFKKYSTFIKVKPVLKVEYFSTTYSS